MPFWLGPIIANWKLFLVGGLIAGAFLLGWNISSSNWEKKYNVREREIAQATAIESDRQYLANERAKEIERKRIETIRNLELELDRVYKEIINEADTNPDRDSIGLSLGGVQRLNRIGK